MTKESVEQLENIGTNSSSLFVDLNGNNMVELEKDFLKLPDATNLSMEFCNISRIHPYSFSVLKNVRDLRLSSNRIGSLPDGLFESIHNLDFLDLSWNQLTSLSAAPFRRGQRVKELRVHNNSIEQIEESLFDRITMLTNVDLSTNKLASLPASISQQSLLTTIILMENNLTAVENGTFKGLSLVQELNLMRNQISVIESGAFYDMKLVRMIYLVDNNLTTVPIGLFLPLSQCTVWINCCQLEKLPQIPKNVKIQCFAGRGNGMQFHANRALARQLAYSGFVCKELELEAANFMCGECPTGTMASTPNHCYGAKDLTSFCYTCPAGGWYQNKAGQKRCKKCVNGTYVAPDKAPGRNPLECSVCPTGTDTNRHAGYRACLCLDGYYRLDRFGPCKPCNDTSPGLECNREYPAVKPGYWWSWANSGDEQQHYVNFVRQLKIKNDSYNKTFTAFKGNLPIVYRCQLQGSCQGGITDEEMCAKGYVGPLCGVCDIDYFSWFSACQQCPPLWRNILQLLVVVFLFALLMFGLFMADRLRMTHRRRASTIIDQISSKAKILIGFAQVMAGVLSALSYVHWPNLLLRAGIWLNLVKLNVVEMANPSCLSPHLRFNALQRIVVNVFGQCLLIFLIFVYYRLRYCLIPFIWRRFRASDQARSLSRRSCFRNCWWILFLGHPSNTAYIMATLPYKDWTCLKLCQYDNDLSQDCPRYLKADLSIQCNYYDGHHKALFITCWSMVVYVVLLPLLLVLGLYKRRGFIKSQSSSDEEFVALKERYSRSWEDFFKSLEFLDENYKTKFWYWELLEIARKFLLTCGLTYFGSDNLSGVAIAALIANLFMLLHAQFEPVKRKSEHSLQLLSLLVISLSLMLGTLIALEQATSDDTTPSDNADDRCVFSVIVLLVHGIFVTYLLGTCICLIVSAYWLIIILCPYIPCRTCFVCCLRFGKESSTHRRRR
jgi:hypothetical protein